MGLPIYENLKIEQHLEMFALKFPTIPTLKDVTARDYQYMIKEYSIEHFRNEWKAVKSGQKEFADPALIHACVGSGKTYMMSYISYHLRKAKMKVMILAHQGELVDQNAEACWECGVGNSIFSASLNMKPERSKQKDLIIGSSGTVVNALEKELKGFIPDVIIIDECHLVNAKDPNTNYMRIINHYRQLNPCVLILGLTGSPYRGMDRIYGENSFWKKRIGPEISVDFLVGRGQLVPTVFGDADISYDLGDVSIKSEHGTADYSDKELAEFEKNMKATVTQKIMIDVVKKTANRNGVLITCASRRHCEEAAKFLPKGSKYAIITEKDTTKTRKPILDAAKKGEVKYIFQIGCLTTGVNVTYWDTSVILRPIGSLTLLIQLMGRGMRLLKDFLVEAGYTKTEHMVLDYTDTFTRMHADFCNPMLEEAMHKKAQRKKKDVLVCPLCETINSGEARRCIGRDKKNVRCEHFWSFKECTKCGTKNDSTARECRGCDALLIDYNKDLNRKHYTEAEQKPLMAMDFVATRNGALMVNFEFDVYDHNGKQEVARLFFTPWSNQTCKRIWIGFLQDLLGKGNFGRFINVKNAGSMVGKRDQFPTPISATHRINDRNKSIVKNFKYEDK